MQGLCLAFESAAAQVGFWGTSGSLREGSTPTGRSGRAYETDRKGAGRTTNVFLVAPLWALARTLGEPDRREPDAALGCYPLLHIAAWGYAWTGLTVFTNTSTHPPR